MCADEYRLLLFFTLSNNFSGEIVTSKNKPQASEVLPFRKRQLRETRTGQPEYKKTQGRV